MLEEECGLTGASVVADVGSGTGILSQLFLENGNQGFGVEPNREMREAGEHLLGGYASFTSVPGTAEATTFRDGSVDHGPMLEELGEVFEAHQTGGTVTVEYDTRVYYGRPGG